MKKHTTDYSKFDSLMQQQKEEEDEEEELQLVHTLKQCGSELLQSRPRMTRIGSSSATSADAEHRRVSVLLCLSDVRSCRSFPSRYYSSSKMVRPHPTLVCGCRRDPTRPGTTAAKGHAWLQGASAPALAVCPLCLHPRRANVEALRGLRPSSRSLTWMSSTGPLSPSHLVASKKSGHNLVTWERHDNRGAKTQHPIWVRYTLGEKLYAGRCVSVDTG